VGQVVEAYADAIAMGPRVVREPRVPAFSQMRHFMTARNRVPSTPQEARGEAPT
jgi:hypothetical protein